MFLKELTLELCSNLDLATLSLSFFDIFMLLYGKDAGLSNFWPDFWAIEKILLP